MHGCHQHWTLHRAGARLGIRPIFGRLVLNATDEEHRRDFDDYAAAAARGAAQGAVTGAIVRAITGPLDAGTIAAGHWWCCHWYQRSSYRG
jgi:hypothetical protein